MAWFDLPKAMRAALVADSQLTAIVNDRIHYQELPQTSVYPHVWFTRTSRNRDELLDGSEEMTISRFSFEIVSDGDAEAIIDRIVATMKAFEGQHGGQDVQLVQVDDGEDDYIFQSVGEGEPDYLHVLQVAVYSVEQ